MFQPSRSSEFATFAGACNELRAALLSSSPHDVTPVVMLTIRESSEALSGREHDEMVVVLSKLSQDLDAACVEDLRALAEVADEEETPDQLSGKARAHATALADVGDLLSQRRARDGEVSGDGIAPEALMHIGHIAFMLDDEALAARYATMAGRIQSDLKWSRNFVRELDRRRIAIERQINALPESTSVGDRVRALCDEFSKQFPLLQTEISEQPRESSSDGRVRSSCSRTNGRVLVELVEPAHPIDLGMFPGSALLLSNLFTGGLISIAWRAFWDMRGQTREPRDVVLSKVPKDASLLATLHPLLLLGRPNVFYNLAFDYAKQLLSGLSQDISPAQYDFAPPSRIKVAPGGDPTLIEALGIIGGAAARALNRVSLEQAQAELDVPSPNETAQHPTITRPHLGALAYQVSTEGDPLPVLRQIEAIVSGPAPGRIYFDVTEASLRRFLADVRADCSEAIQCAQRSLEAIARHKASIADLSTPQREREPAPATGPVGHLHKALREAGEKLLIASDSAGQIGAIRELLALLKQTDKVLGEWPGDLLATRLREELPKLQRAFAARAHFENESLAMLIARVENLITKCSSKLN